MRRLVVVELLVDDNVEEPVEVVRAVEHDLFEELAGFHVVHVEFRDGRAELLCRDRADAADEVRDALEHLVDVLVRVVDEEVVVLEPDVDALLIHRDLDEYLLHREHDLVLVLGTIIRLDKDQDFLRRRHQRVDAL